MEFSKKDLFTTIVLGIIIDIFLSILIAMIFFELNFATVGLILLMFIGVGILVALYSGLKAIIFNFLFGKKLIRQRLRDIWTANAFPKDRKLHEPLRSYFMRYIKKTETELNIPKHYTAMWAQLTELENLYAKSSYVSALSYEFALEDVFKKYTEVKELDDKFDY